MNTCYIVGASPRCASFTPDESDLVIAADGGHETLARMGSTPHLAVGDFDSSAPPVGIPTVRHPVDKDDSDTVLAVKEGIARGYEYFLLYGCTGGRPDHTFAAVQTLYHIAREGFHGYLVGDGMVSTVIVNRSLHFAPNGTVSVFSLTDESFGVTIEGLRYTLSDAQLTNDIPLGLSNHGDGGAAKIAVREGALYVMWEDPSAL